MRDTCIVCGAKPTIWYPILKPDYPAFCHEHNKFEFKDKYGCDRDNWSVGEENGKRKR